jgi:SAM-dependent methyltransferase
MGERKRKLASGQAPDARAAISRAVELLRSGNPDQARALCEPLFEAALSDPEALHYLGYLAIELGRPDRAIGLLQRAIKLQTGVAHFHNTLAIAFLRSAQPESAVEPLQRAIALSPELHEPIGNLGNTLLSLGRYAEAAACYRRAVRLAPQIGTYWSSFAEAMSNTTGVPDPDLRPDLLAALVHDEVEPKSLVRTVISLLRNTPQFEEARRLAEQDALASAPEKERAALQDPLLLRLLESTIVTDAAMERMLTQVRRMLLQCRIEGRVSPLSLEFIAALAKQCFATEYAWFVSPEEDAMLAVLEEQVIEMMRAVPSAWEHTIAIYAAYRPLHRVPGIAALPAQEPSALQGLLRQQIVEPAEEARLQREIPVLHPIEDPVSRAVQEQYEDNPFPRWVRVARFDHARPLATVLRELFPHKESAPPPAKAPHILVAGCGTGIHPVRSAFRFEGASILAVDLSRASLAHALRKTRELGIRNLEYAQADLLRIGELDRRFDLIECVGVLHHLRDPMAGWRSLMKILAPNGFMRIGLYSELGRSRIKNGQAFARREGYPATEDGIRRLRRALLTAAESDQELAAMLLIHDTYSLSGFRDLFLHVQEHRFTVPQIATALRDLGLEFLGFEMLGPHVTERYLGRFPADPAMDDLSNWHAFEEAEPDTFAGMYRFWVRRRK